MNVEVKLVPVVKPQHTWTLHVEDLTEREIQLLRRILGANITIPDYIHRCWSSFYRPNEVYDFLAKIAAGIDSAGVPR